MLYVSDLSVYVFYSLFPCSFFFYFDFPCFSQKVVSHCPLSHSLYLHLCAPQCISLCFFTADHTRNIMISVSEHSLKYIYSLDVLTKHRSHHFSKGHVYEKCNFNATCGYRSGIFFSQIFLVFKSQNGAAEQDLFRPLFT